MSDISEEPVIESAGNVFADLGLPTPDERLLKAALAYAIASIITSQHLTQTQAANVLGTDHAKISALTTGRLAGFSIERLLRFLLALDRDIAISIRPKPETRASRVELVEVA